MLDLFDWLKAALVIKTLSDLSALRGTASTAVFPGRRRRRGSGPRAWTDVHVSIKVRRSIQLKFRDTKFLIEDAQLEM